MGRRGARFFLKITRMMQVMNKMFCFLMACGGIIVGCHSSGGYLIKGQVEEGSCGNVYVVRQLDKDHADTLGRGRMENGVFSVKGSVNSVTPVVVEVDGAFPASVYLENGAVFNIKYKAGEMPVVEGGGESQRLNDEYVKLGLKPSEDFEQWKPEFEKAMRSRDTAKLREIHLKIEQIRVETDKMREEFLKTHGNTFFALYYLSRHALDMTAEEVQKRFDLCSEELKKSELGRYVASLVLKLRNLEIGAVVPNFTSKTPEGKDVALYDVKAKVKLIDFWASNCGVCREENRKVVPLYHQYHEQGFEVISYSFDKKRELWLQAVAQDGLPWIQVSDLKGNGSKEVTEAFGVYTLPTTLLVDENNKVIARNIRVKELGQMLPKLLRGREK